MESWDTGSQGNTILAVGGVGEVWRGWLVGGLRGKGMRRWCEDDGAAYPTSAGQRAATRAVSSTPRPVPRYLPVDGVEDPVLKVVVELEAQHDRDRDRVGDREYEHNDGLVAQACSQQELRGWGKWVEGSGGGGKRGWREAGGEEWLW